MLPDYKNQKLVFTGDSITDCGHLWDSGEAQLGNGYVRRLKELLPEAAVINQGHDGYTAFQLWEHWEADCIRFHPDIVTVLVGINDVCAHLCGAGGYGAEQYSIYLQQIIDETRGKTAAQIVFMEPFLFPKPAEYLNWMPSLGNFRAQMRRVADKNHISFVPLYSIFQQALETNPLDSLTTDGIHLTPLGHRIIADAWIENPHAPLPRQRL